MIFNNRITGSRIGIDIERPLVRRESKTQVEHVVTRDSASKVAYENKLREDWAEQRLDELNSQLQTERAQRNRYETRYDNTPSAIQQERLADKIYESDREIERIRDEIEDIQSGEVQPGPYMRGHNPESLSIRQIEDHLPPILHDVVDNIGVSDEPIVQAKRQEAIIITDISGLPSEIVQDITQKYQDIELLVKDVRFR